MKQPKREIVNSDVDFWIEADGKQFGHLHISRRGLDWFYGRSTTRKRSITWEHFADLIENVAVTKALRPKLRRK